MIDKLRKSIVIIGGGAAGYFSAINIATKHPAYSVTILEKSDKYLSKVRVSGGGRCNVTNQRSKPSELVTFYPRGQKKLYPVFKTFSSSDMVNWLEEKGVKTHAEADQRMFPVSNSSQTIIDCFVNETHRLGVKIQFNTSVKALSQRGAHWTISTKKGEIEADKVIFATGSSASSFNILKDLGLKQTSLAPSLFTFNIVDQRIKDLPGVSFPEVEVKIVGTKLTESGPMLITHWGLSGPAILKLSAWGALELQDMKYQFQILVNFVPDHTQEALRDTLASLKTTNPNRKTTNHPLFGLSRRFWERLCEYCEIDAEQQSGDLSKKQINKLTEELTQGRYDVKGKSTFKEEFVTCGGIELEEIELATFECKKFPGLYLAGEVLNIDALTGGFNFQACWSAGWIISENI
ncbi:MAG: putative Rossmann fold flavoprotein [Cyclobacteriaceae bacterium]